MKKKNFKKEEEELINMEMEFLKDTYKMTINYFKNLDDNKKVKMVKNGEFNKLLDEMDKLKSRILKKTDINPYVEEFLKL